MELNRHQELYAHIVLNECSEGNTCPFYKEFFDGLKGFDKLIFEKPNLEQTPNDNDYEED